MQAGNPEEPDRGSPGLFVTYYTDPLCCWSWAFEPEWRRLRRAFAGRLSWRLRMGGMIDDWSRFSDPVNAISQPSQMGPLWLEVHRRTGVPIEPRIWVDDPPASSWPSSLAVKAAELQSAHAADLLLHALRAAVMAGGRNIARPEVILDVASGCAADRPDLLDLARFRSDLDGREARSALLDDVKEARFRGIGRFPALAIAARGADPVLLVGWHPYAALRDAVAAVAPDLRPACEATG